jgi:hypothetical protein
VRRTEAPPGLIDGLAGGTPRRRSNYLSHVDELIARVSHQPRSAAKTHTTTRGSLKR